MIVHVLATHPRNGQPKSAPLVGLCGKDIAGLYTRRANHASRIVCPECKAALAKNSEGRAWVEDETETEAASE
jgi:hypothetical protein